MSAYQDRNIIVQIRRELVRRQAIDASLVNVHCINGVVELTGSLTLTPYAETKDPKEELKTVREIILRFPGVRDVIDRYLRVL